MRCEKTDLPTAQCAHCRGVGLDVEPDQTATSPFPAPPAVPARPRPKRRPTPTYQTRVLNEIDDLYERLFENLPAESRGQSSDNAAGFAPTPDPRRAPVRVEVLDLIARIEDDLPDMARMVCDTMGVMRCVAFPQNSAEGSPDPSPRVKVALATLDRHWPGFESRVPEAAEAVAENLSWLVARARRMVGESVAPVPLATPCPACSCVTVFRVDTAEGQVAVCGNPECRDHYGEQHRWNETEWEDAHNVYSQ